MKKKPKLIFIFSTCLLIGGFSVVKGDDCNPLYSNYNNCLTDCRHDCIVSNPIDYSGCINNCPGNCSGFLNEYNDCVNGGEGDPEPEEQGEGEEEGEEEGEGDEYDNCESYGDHWYYDPQILGCLECTKPLINDSCESYGGSWILNDLGTCCKEGGSCQHPTDENGSCGDGMVVDPNLAGCCMACNNPPQSGECQQGFVLQNNCCLNAGNCQSGYYDNNTQCIQCTGDTMPNEAHTRCICNPDKKCCGVQLNMELPFIGDCIEMNTNSSNPGTTSVSSVTAFPILMQGLMKIVMSIILIFSFLMIIVAGLMMTAGAFKSSSYDKGKNILKNVIISLILLGSSGLILSLINPSFFGG